jgi:hypothetical protein
MPNLTAEFAEAAEKRPKLILYFLRALRGAIFDWNYRKDIDL